MFSRQKPQWHHILMGRMFARSQASTMAFAKGESLRKQWANIHLDWMEKWGRKLPRTLSHQTENKWGSTWAIIHPLACLKSRAVKKGALLGHKFSTVVLRIGKVNFQAKGIISPFSLISWWPCQTQPISYLSSPVFDRILRFPLDWYESPGLRRSYPFSTHGAGR